MLRHLEGLFFFNLFLPITYALCTWVLSEQFVVIYHRFLKKLQRVIISYRNILKLLKVDYRVFILTKIHCSVML